MCQLTFVHSDSKKLAQLLTYCAGFVNSDKTNKDGSGFFSGGKLFKTELCQSNITNMGELISSRVISPDVISHVRLATATNNVKKVCKENSHPFEYERFVLAHNGSLETIDPKLEKEERFKDKIDSEIFAMMLEEVSSKLSKDTPMDEILRQTYSTLFRGKFAFLIYDKLYKKYYAARGDTALLYACNFTVVDLGDESKKSEMYILNTDKSDLEKSLVLFTNILQISYNKSVLWPEDVKDWILLLKENSVFSLDKKIERIGELKEEKKYVAPTTSYHGDTAKAIIPVSTTTNGRGFYTNNKNSFSDKSIENNVVKIMETFGVGLEYINDLVYLMYGKNISDFNPAQLPSVFSHATNELSSTNNGIKRKKLIRAWKWLRSRNDDLDEIDLHKKFKIPFPYTHVTDIEQLKG